MENPIEHLDLGFVNFTKHPENPNFVVYRFTDPERANSFRAELIANNISFEEEESIIIISYPLIKSVLKDHGVEF